MKGYDSINRYCGRLETALDDTANKDKIVDEIKSHLQEQTESYIAEGCVPEIAELYAIENMGSAKRLAKQLKKYNQQRQKEHTDDYGVWEYALFEGYVHSSPMRVWQKNIISGNIRYQDAFYYVLVYLWSSILWLYLSINTVADKIGFFAPFTLLGVIVFSLFLRNIDRYKPALCKFNLITLGVTVVISILFKDLLKLFLFNGGIFIMENTFIFYLSFPKIYFSVKLIISLAVLGVTIYKVLTSGDGLKYILPILCGMVLPAVALLFDSINFRFFLALIITLYTVVTSVYFTYNCRCKYYLRIVQQFYGVIGLAEILALITIGGR